MTSNPTTLTRRPSLLESSAFLRWFEGSKIVGPDGKPLPVYHGTSERWTRMLTAQERLDRFDKQTVGAPVDWVLFNRGIVERTGAALWFSEFEDVAEGFSDQSEHPGDRGVLSGYLSIKNPLDLRPANRDPEETEEILSKAFGRPVSISLAYGMDKGIAHAIIPDNSRVVAYARDLGYDGLIYPDTDVYGRSTHTSFVAFEPGQFKSAEYAGGEIDRDDPDIRCTLSRPAQR